MYEESEGVVHEDLFSYSTPLDKNHTGWRGTQSNPQVPKCAMTPTLLWNLPGLKNHDGVGST